MTIIKFVSIFLVVIIGFAIILLLPGILFVSGLPDGEPPKFKNESFNQLANDILNQNQINSMDDLTRFTKKVNDIYVTLDKSGKSESSNTIFIDSLLDSLKIDKQIFNNLRRQLERTKLREFFKSNDSILFVADGWMSHSYGYFYSKKPMIFGAESFRFAGHFVRVYNEVNSNWKKAEITP